MGYLAVVRVGDASQCIQDQLVLIVEVALAFGREVERD
jgi:hypothetical protein